MTSSVIKSPSNSIKKPKLQASNSKITSPWTKKLRLINTLMKLKFGSLIKDALGTSDSKIMPGNYMSIMDFTKNMEPLTISMEVSKEEKSLEPKALKLVFKPVEINGLAM